MCATGLVRSVYYNPGDGLSFNVEWCNRGSCAITHAKMLSYLQVGEEEPASVRVVSACPGNRKFVGDVNPPKIAIWSDGKKISHSGRVTLKKTAETSFRLETRNSVVWVMVVRSKGHQYVSFCDFERGKVRRFDLELFGKGVTEVEFRYLSGGRLSEQSWGRVDIRVL